MGLCAVDGPLHGLGVDEVLHGGLRPHPEAQLVLDHRGQRGLDDVHDVGRVGLGLPLGSLRAHLEDSAVGLVAILDLLHELLVRLASLLEVGDRLGESVLVRELARQLSTRRRPEARQGCRAGLTCGSPRSR